MSRYKTISDILHDIKSTAPSSVPEPLPAPVSQPTSPRSASLHVSELRRMNSAEKLVTRALGHFALREFGQAADLCRKALALDPENEEAQETLGFVRGRDRDATALYEQIARRVDNPDLKELRDLLHTARAMYPNHPLDSRIGARVDERNNLFWRAMNEGWRYARRRETRNALEAFRRAYAIDPGNKDLPSTIRELEDYVRKGKPVPLLW